MARPPIIAQSGKLFRRQLDDALDYLEDNLGGGGGSSAWGGITGTLSDQTDLQAALDAKVATSSLATVATTGSYGDLTGIPGTFTPAAHTHTEADITDLGSYQPLATVLTNTTASYTTAEETKLAGIETGATADQTGSEIKAAYEAEANTNAFTDAEKTKLAGIATGAEVNAVDSVNTQTGAVVLDADDIADAATTNKFTTASDISKLAGIESGATADQSDSEIETAYNNQVSVVSQAEGEAGTATTVRRWTAQRVKQAIDALAPSGGSSVYSVHKRSGPGGANSIGTGYTFNWDTEELKSGSDITWSGTNPSRLTIATAGIYRIGGFITVSSSDQRAQTSAEIRINGTSVGVYRSGSYIRNTGDSWDFWCMEIAPEPFQLSVNDYVEIAAVRNSGATGYNTGTAHTIYAYNSLSRIWVERAA